MVLDLLRSLTAMVLAVLCAAEGKSGRKNGGAEGGLIAAEYAEVTRSSTASCCVVKDFDVPFKDEGYQLNLGNVAKLILYGTGACKNGGKTEKDSENDAEFFLSAPDFVQKVLREHLMLESNILPASDTTCRAWDGPHINKQYEESLDSLVRKYKMSSLSDCEDAGMVLSTQKSHCATQSKAHSALVLYFHTWWVTTQTFAQWATWLEEDEQLFTESCKDDEEAGAKILRLRSKRDKAEAMMKEQKAALKDFMFGLMLSDDERDA